MQVLPALYVLLVEWIVTLCAQALPTLCPPWQRRASPACLVATTSSRSRASGHAWPVSLCLCVPSNDLIRVAAECGSGTEVDSTCSSCIPKCLTELGEVRGTDGRCKCSNPNLVSLYGCGCPAGVLRSCSAFMIMFVVSSGTQYAPTYVANGQAGACGHCPPGVTPTDLMLRLDNVQAMSTKPLH